LCGRYSSSSSTKELARILDVDEVRADELSARYNVAPTMPVYAVALSRTERETGRKTAPHRVLGTFQWGLVPSWAKDPKVGNRMINARAETLATKPAYRRAFAGHRVALLPAYPVGREHPPQRRQGNVCSLLRSV
jgi:putative SOS response-associated peptidase YedK